VSLFYATLAVTSKPARGDMDLTALKTALSDEQHAELTKFVDDLTGQRDAARK
jgi:hypothetical protein